MPDKPTPDETYVRFRGMKTAGEFEKIPMLGERQTFTVIAECDKELHHELMADGHRRPVVGMKVLEVNPGKISPAPKDDQLMLGEDDDGPIRLGGDEDDA